MGRGEREREIGDIMARSRIVDDIRKVRMCSALCADGESDIC